MTKFTFAFLILPFLSSRTSGFFYRATPSVDFHSEFRPKNEKEFLKLEVDLMTVFEKVKLCREMLLESPGIQEDEALAEVVGFLEACRDRMADVIEAGTQGLLNEALLAKCFRANDAIFRTLDAEKVRIIALHSFNDLYLRIFFILLPPTAL